MPIEWHRIQWLDEHASVADGQAPVRSRVAGGQALGQRRTRVKKAKLVAATAPAAAVGNTDPPRYGRRRDEKGTGSPFGAAMWRSCFLCGRHRANAALMTRRLLGKAQRVCADGCRRDRSGMQPPG
jgi:hypothetical protein